MIWVVLFLASTATSEAFYRDAKSAQANHDFQTAIALTNQGLQHNPDAPALLAMSANLHRIKGNFNSAHKACSRLYTAAAFSVGFTCATQVLLSRGALSVVEANRRLTVLDNAHVTADPSLRSWLLSVKADLAIAAKQNQRAVDFLQQSLAMNIDRSARHRLGSLLLSMHRPQAAIALTRASDTEPALQLIRLKALKALARNAEAVALGAALDEEFKHAIENSDLTHSREMTAFYLDGLPDPTLARTLATLNWNIQKEPEDRLLLQRATDRSSI